MMNWLKRECRGWSRAWKVLRDKYKGLYVCPNYREQWEYMGTYANHHEFRHRSLYGVRTIERIPVDETDFDLCEEPCEVFVPQCTSPVTFDSGEAC